MAYIQFDLDAKRKCRFIARASGVPTEVIGWGLLELWEYCWVEKQAEVGGLMLSGFFGGHAETLVPHLVAHGFLSEAGPGRFTVRGAEKRLGILKARQAGGRAASGNLKQNRAGLSRQRPGVEPDLQPDLEPVATSGSAPGLTSSIQHPASNKEAAVAPARVAILAPVAPPPPPATPTANCSLPAAFFARVQSARVDHGLVAERPPKPEKLERWYSEAMGELGGDERLLWATYEHYSEDKYWGKADPPWPFRGFLAQWRDYVPRRKIDSG